MEAELRGADGEPVHSVRDIEILDAKTVDFRYAPPQWQTAICLPDDPQKTLVDKSGELLYHYSQGGREFGTRIAVQVTGDAVWQKQELLSPRVPIVRTYRTAPGWRSSKRRSPSPACRSHLPQPTVRTCSSSM